MHRLMDGANVEVAPGVEGVVKVFPNMIEIISIRAQSEGSGQVGEYLDSLPTDCRIVVPNVLNDRLAGMLERRGFTRKFHYETYMVHGEIREGWIRRWIRNPVND